uniref:Uncharacterized protein n=1 Tax=Arundo donax TaxID=35708 RepID=A0A0A9D9H4_ARUDO
MSQYHRTPVAQELFGTASLGFRQTKAHPRHGELKRSIVFKSKCDLKFFQIYMHGIATPNRFIAILNGHNREVLHGVPDTPYPLLI